MAWQLKSVCCPERRLDFIRSIHIRWHTSCSSSSRDTDTFLKSSPNSSSVIVSHLLKTFKGRTLPQAFGGTQEILSCFFPLTFIIQLYHRNLAQNILELFPTISANTQRHGFSVISSADIGTCHIGKVIPKLIFSVLCSPYMINERSFSLI